MTGYVRNDTVNNIADGNIINASDLDGEYDAIQAAFNAATGHTHDGTTGEGAPIVVVGPTQDVVVTATAIRPKTDNTVDLGTSTLEFKDLYLDGTANIDNLAADAATVGGSAVTTAANTQTLTNKTLNLSNNTLVATSAQLAAAITDETGTGSVVFSASPVLTGTPTAPTAAAGTNTTQVATTAHVFAERTNTATLTNKTLTSPVINTPDINNGTIDGAVIGGSSAAAGTFTTLNTSGNVVFNEAGADVDFRVESDTNANALFVDGATGNVGIGTSSPAVSGLEVRRITGTASPVPVEIRLSSSDNDADWSTTDPWARLSFWGADGSNSGAKIHACIDTTQYNQVGGLSTVSIKLAEGSSGVLRPRLEFEQSGSTIAYAGGTERLRITPTGNVGIGSASPPSDALLTLAGAQGTTQSLYFNGFGSDLDAAISHTNANLIFSNGGNNTGVSSLTERLRITSTGNVGIGTSSPASKVHVAASAPTSRTTFTGDAATFVGTGINVACGTGTSGIYFPDNNFIQRVSIESDGSRNMIFNTANTERARIDSSGNVLIGGTTAGTASAGNLVLFNGTAPTGNVTNGVTLYAEDVSASSELKVRDEAGNITTLSPHNFDLIPEGPSEEMAWSYYSERDGKRINVDMLKAIRLLEQITGEKLVHMT